ncbi:MAG: DUF3089 domain-containing protein [Sphingomonas sp.]|nr:DUF3089 domain-containing protein [Sphingomonas sp.]
MAARLFLGIIALLTVLVVGGVTAYYLYGDEILAEQAMPTVEFVAPPEEDRPLYDEDGDWLVKPGVGEDLVGWEPGEFLPHPYFDQSDVMIDDAADPVDLTPAAIFYVHPTTYLQRDRWNAPIELDGNAAFRARIFIQSQASAFAAMGQVWAPRYRQAAYGAFLSTEPDALSALDVAFEDVSTAFDAFLAANPEGPIILAGHSQGSLHLLRLLKTRGSEIADRLVVAYIVGWPIDRAVDVAVTGPPVCSRRDESGCIMTWLTFADPANPNLFMRTWEEGNGSEPLRSRERLICTNPITGGEPNEEPALGRGTLVPTDGLQNATLAQGAVRARCDEGLLTLAGEVPELGPYTLPGNNYHVYDYALFYGDIRHDADRRREGWERAR